jgi:hypothetical protein
VKIIASLVTLSWSSVLLWGCQAQTVRHEGVTPGAGDAMAANTVMQMVDPWPAGVENTALATPADLEQYRKRPADENQNGAVEGDYTGGATAQ